MQVDIGIQINISPELKQEITSFASKSIHPNGDSQAPYTIGDLKAAQQKAAGLLLKLIDELEK